MATLSWRGGGGLVLPITFSSRSKCFVCLRTRLTFSFLALTQKTHLIVKKFNMGAKEASAALGMGDDFDYPS